MVLGLQDGGSYLDPYQAVHPDPIWRHRANYILRVDIEPDGTTLTSEQMWARKIDDRHFELCCIPFFTYGMALGDVVEADDQNNITHVTRPSGRWVFRVWFAPENRMHSDDVFLGLAERGALVEWWSASMFAVDATDAEHAQLVADYLQEEEDQARLVYETGRD